MAGTSFLIVEGGVGIDGDSQLFVKVLYVLRREGKQREEKESGREKAIVIVMIPSSMQIGGDGERVGDLQSGASLMESGAD